MAEVPAFFSRKKPNLGEDALLKASSSKQGAPHHCPAKQADKTRDTVPEEHRVNKKLRAAKRQNLPHSTSAAAKFLGHVGDTVISDEELWAWRAKFEEDKDAWILKASCEMLIHNMDRDDAKAVQDTRLSYLENENSHLKKDFKKLEKTLQAAENGKKSAEESLNKETARLSGLEGEIADLKKNSSLEAANKSLVEKKDKAVDASFYEGVCSYVATFLSGEPNYKWLPKFGKVADNYMAEFPSKHPELMAAKQAELADTLAKEAVSDEARQEGDDQAGNLDQDAP